MGLNAYQPTILSFFFSPLHSRLRQTILNFPFEEQAETLTKCKREKKKKKSIYFVLETISSKEYTIHLLEQQQKKKIKASHHSFLFHCANKELY